MSNKSSFTAEEILGIVRMDAVAGAVESLDLTYDPSEREKIEQIMSHPELLARVIGMIAGRQSDKEIADAFSIQPISVGLIRRNEFVVKLCQEVFNATINDIKMGLSSAANNAVTSLAMLVDPESPVGEKTRYMAAMGIINTMLKLSGDLKGDAIQKNTINSTQIHITPEAREVYDRVVADMASIKPVMETLIVGEVEEDEPRYTENI